MASNSSLPASDLTTYPLAPALKEALTISDIGLLAQEKDFRVRSKLANFSSGGDAIQFRKADIQENQIRLQLFGFLNGFQSICRLPDDLKLSPFLQLSNK